MWLLRGLLLLCAIINAEVLGVPEAAEDQASTSSARAPERDMACDLEQKGLHMRLRCSLTPTARGAWDQCTISIDLARGVYANPYELMDRSPDIKFTVSRKAVRESSWFSRTFLSTGDTIESSSEQEVSLNASQVDIEAPSWRSEPLRWRFSFNTTRQLTNGAEAAIELDIPLHLRYHLPSTTGAASHGAASRTGFVCAGAAGTSEADEGAGDTQFASRPHGCSSDLLLVLPLTLVFLVIGIVTLLFH